MQICGPVSHQGQILRLYHNLNHSHTAAVPLMRFTVSPAARSKLGPHQQSSICTNTRKNEKERICELSYIFGKMEDNPPTAEDSEKKFADESPRADRECGAEQRYASLRETVKLQCCCCGSKGLSYSYMRTAFRPLPPSSQWKELMRSKCVQHWHYL